MRAPAVKTSSGSATVGLAQTLSVSMPHALDLSPRGSGDERGRGELSTSSKRRDRPPGGCVPDCHGRVHAAIASGVGDLPDRHVVDDRNGERSSRHPGAPGSTARAGEVPRDRSDSVRDDARPHSIASAGTEGEHRISHALLEAHAAGRSPVGVDHDHAQRGRTAIGSRLARSIDVEIDAVSGRQRGRVPVVPADLSSPVVGLKTAVCGRWRSAQHREIVQQLRQRWGRPAAGCGIPMTP